MDVVHLIYPGLSLAETNFLMIIYGYINRDYRYMLSVAGASEMCICLTTMQWLPFDGKAVL